MTRHGLLLTAVATVTVPGLLAMMAALGHQHVAAGAGAVPVALDGVPLSGTSPAASVTMPAAVHHDVAWVQAVSSAPGAALSSVTTGQQALGMRLLDLSANASLATTYQGMELASQSGVGGNVTMTSRVWHEAGGPTFVETSDGAAAAPARSAAARSAGVAVASSDPASGSPEGVFGVTKGLMALLSKHYSAVYWGSGSVAGRSASVVELYRSDGSVAARYWLDSETLVPLRRELLGTSGNVISEDSFVRVRFGAFAPPRIVSPAASPSQSSQQARSSAWVAASSPAGFLAALTRRGWRVPSTPPGGLPLYAAAATRTASGKIVELEYTDGLYVVSLFVQRGTLAPDMPGWQPVRVAGQQAYVSGHSVTWAGPGFVYTVIADAPPQTVEQIVKTMPSGSPGILARFGRGFARLAQMLNPFG